jgi:hypothetical protein
VVNARQLAELQRIDDEADVAVLREPEAVILEGGLVAVATTAGVAADVENGGVLVGTRSLRWKITRSLTA